MPPGSEITQERSQPPQRFKNTWARAQRGGALPEQVPKVPETGTGCGTPSALCSQGTVEAKCLSSQCQAPWDGKPDQLRNF